jgi:acylphosphatase
VTDSLAGLLRSLQLAGLDIDPEAALDSVWLGLRMREKTVAAERARAAEGDSSSLGDGTVPADALGDATRQQTTDGGRQRDTLTSRTGQYPVVTAASAAAPPAPARVLTLARAAALPESRELIKALRPLRRRVVSPGAGVLDIDTTVRRAAEEDLWIPAFESERERWLDVLLVADHGLSMIIWQDTIDEFERVLRNSGAFRSVRSWWLESGTDELAISPRGRAPRPATPQTLTRLVRGTSRSVVLLISDCVGPRWHDGAIPRLVAEWSQRLPVALVQVTPEWFWSRTSLGDTVLSRFRTPIPANVNRRFRWDPTALGAGAVTRETEPTFLRVPATTLTSAAVSRVAGLIAGVGREWAPGVVFDLTWEGETDGRKPSMAGAEERVARFRALASKPAQRLAVGFAASPVRTLGVLRLLRRDLLHNASPFAEAEVLLGGVLRVRREDARWDLGAALPLEFFPGIQPLLLDGAVAADVVRVLTHAASVAASGVGETFTSWLTDPTLGAGQLDPSDSAFAASAAEVLSRLGGAYARIVKPVPTGTETVVSTVSQSDAAPAEQAIETQVEPTVQPDDGFIGRPHQLVVPKTLVGRDEVVNKILRWEQEELAQMPMMLLGPEGIGKTAIVARVLRGWRERWADEEAFVWNFQRDPSTHEVYEALRNWYADPRSQLEAGDVIEGLRRRTRTLVVFDGIDGIRSPADMESLIATAEQISDVESARVLLTGRRLPTPLRRLKALTIDSLARDDLGLLLTDALPARETISIVLDLSNGNPLVGLTLLPIAESMTGRVVLEELSPDPRKHEPIAPGLLPLVLEQLDRAARARELSASGKALIDKSELDAALVAFSEVVRIRGALPSLLLRGRALVDRGELMMRQTRFGGAMKDLEDAASIFGSLSAKPDQMNALKLLAVACVAKSQFDEALELFSHALRIATEIEDRPAMLGLFSALATVQAHRGALQEAIAFARQAVDIADRIGDARAAGNAHLQAARILKQMNNREPALADARAALGLFQSVNDSDQVAKAAEEIAELERDPNDPDRVQSVEYHVKGRVAGVFFRVFVQNVTRELGILGEATNLPDGRVRVRASGPRSLLEQLEARLRQGPANAKVDEVEVRILEDSEAAAQRVVARSTSPTAPNEPAPLKPGPNEGRAVIAIGVGRIGNLPKLSTAVDGARSVAEWAEKAQGIPRDRVTLFTDESGPVTTLALSSAVHSAIRRGSIAQLIVYFAGYGTRVGDDIKWLLSGVPDDPSAAIAVNGCTTLARHCGIPHVVIISDTARVSATAISTQDVMGQAVFPSAPARDRPGAVDQFHNVVRIDRPLAEVSNLIEEAKRYTPTYTSLLLSALRGNDRSLLEERQGVKFLRPRTLGQYLAKVAPTLSASVGAKQEPETRIESGDDAWLAAFE